MTNYFIDLRLLSIQLTIESHDSDNYFYNMALYHCVKKMRNMNHFFDKPQNETHQLLTELENRLYV